MLNHDWFTKITIGTEAVEAAVKMAIQYYTELPVPEPQRVNIISRKFFRRIFTTCPNAIPTAE